MLILVVGYYLEKLIILYIGYGLTFTGITVLYMTAMINEPD